MKTSNNLLVAARIAGYSIMLIGVGSCATSNYTKIMSKSVKNVIGTDINQYQLFSYPTDNFGLATIYANSTNDIDFICDMWNCIGKSAPNDNKAEWMNLAGYSANGNGASITLTDKEKKSVAYNAILPKIYDVIGISANGSTTLNTQVTLSFSQATLRKLRKQAMADYINGLDNSQLVKQAFNNGSLVVVVADCVISDMSVNIKTDNTVANAIDAKINATGSGVATKLFSNTSLSVKVDKTATGEYTFTVQHPVIVARLFKKQPSAGALAVDDEFKSWTTVIPTSEPASIKLHNMQ